MFDSFGRFYSPTSRPLFPLDQCIVGPLVRTGFGLFEARLAGSVMDLVMGKKSLSAGGFKGMVNGTDAGVVCLLHCSHECGSLSIR